MNTQTRPRSTLFGTVAGVLSFLMSAGLSFVIVMLSPSPAQSDGTPLRIAFDHLLCVEETDEVGADEPYAIVLAANLPTGQSKITIFDFDDVDEGETHRGFPFIIGEWQHVTAAADILILVLLMESDPTPGLEAFHAAHMFAAARDRLPPIVGHYQRYYRENIDPKKAVSDALIVALKNICNETKGDDDLIGIGQLWLDASGLSQAKQRPITKTISVRSDEGEYRIAFQAISSPRSNWVHASGSFKRTLDGRTWVEYQNGRQVYTFVENDFSTMNYVQMWDPNRNVSVRLWGGKCETAPGESPDAGAFKKRYEGGWRTATTPEKDESLPGGQKWIESSGQTAPVNLSGSWKSSLGVVYEIKQTGNTFTWSAPSLKETAKGSLKGNDLLNVEWTGAFGTGSMMGKIAQKDSAGHATRIEWDNRTVFISQSKPITVDVSGTWKSNLGVVYEIKQTGNTFTWSAPSLKETAKGSLTGNDQLKVEWTGSFGTGSTNGKITQKDSSGRATKIQWDNKSIFTRALP